jgi:hypothetical protein
MGNTARPARARLHCTGPKKITSGGANSAPWGVLRPHQAFRRKGKPPPHVFDLSQNLSGEHNHIIFLLAFD